jgi:hypothetical protein
MYIYMLNWSLSKLHSCDKPEAARMDTKIVAMIRNGRGATQRKVWNKFQRHSSVLSFLCLFDKWILYSNWLILISCQYCYNQCMSNIYMYCSSTLLSAGKKIKGQKTIQEHQKDKS